MIFGNTVKSRFYWVVGPKQNVYKIEIINKIEISLSYMPFSAFDTQFFYVYVKTKNWIYNSLKISFSLLFTVHHLLISAIRDCEQMGWDFVPPLSDVHLDHGVGVNRVATVRVDHHAEQARIGLQKRSFIYSVFC